MLFKDSIYGNKIPLAQIGTININGKNVIYSYAKSEGDFIEEFDTEEEAQERYNELKKDLLN